MDNSFALLVSFGVYVLQALAFYKLGEKAGLRNNWIAWIPVLQFIIFFHIIDKSAWNSLLIFIPIANIIFIFIWYAKFFEVFGMTKAWLISLLFGLQAIPMLLAAFGDAEYESTNRYSA